MTDLLNINTVFFTFWDYPMSYLEFFGTLLNIASVWLVTRKNIWTWPIGIIAVVLFAVLFYQIQLYSDFVEQLYFLVTGFYGWWLWVKLRKNEAASATSQASSGGIRVERLTGSGNARTLTIVGVGTLLMGYFVGRIHLFFPAFFPEPAAFPYLDAFTTVLSFTAQILMAHKKLESWLLWIVVDIIGIGLYYTRGVKFISVLYIIFLILATKGFLNWLKEYRELSPQEHNPSKTSERLSSEAT